MNHCPACQTFTLKFSGEGSGQRVLDHITLLGVIDKKRLGAYNIWYRGRRQEAA